MRFASDPVEAVPLVRAGNAASLQPPEQPIASACEQAVAKVQQKRGERADPGQDPPHPAELPEDSHRRPPADEQALSRIAFVQNQSQRVQPGSVEAVPCSRRQPELALKRREAKHPLAIPAKNELHEPVAEPANAVIQHAMVGHFH